jgi:hypothetical protein
MPAVQVGEFGTDAGMNPYDKLTWTGMTVMVSKMAHQPTPMQSPNAIFNVSENIAGRERTDSHLAMTNGVHLPKFFMKWKRMRWTL